MKTLSARVSITLLAAVTLAVLLGVSGAVLATSSSPSIRDAVSCPVTFQPGVLDAPLMGWGSAETAYGTDELSVTLPHGGSLLSSNLDDQGRIWDKFLFWGSSGEGGIEISGRRLDAQAPPLIADGIEPGIGGGLATMITFPTTGCWEVTADRGDIALTFVLLVARAWEDPAGVDGVIVASPEEWTYDRQILIDSWPWVAADPSATLAIDGKVIIVERSSL